jgi:hypothetical protein
MKASVIAELKGLPFGTPTAIIFFRQRNKAGLISLSFPVSLFSRRRLFLGSAPLFQVTDNPAYGRL